MRILVQDGVDVIQQIQEKELIDERSEVEGGKIMEEKTNSKKNVETKTQDSKRMSEVDERVKPQLSHFKSSSTAFDFPPSTSTEIDKFQKRILAFSKQYGVKNQKTTSMQMSYLQAVREAGVNYLKAREINQACSFFADCLTFINPTHDEVFYEKFLLIKVDALSKLLYCIFELEGYEFRRQNSTSDKELLFVVEFLKDVKKFPKYQDLEKNEHCLLEVSYFFLGKMYLKTNLIDKAVECFLVAERILENKLENCQIKNEESRNLLKTILTKTQFKLAKCYCEQTNEEEKKAYEYKAKEGARETNERLFTYIHKNLELHKRKKEFEQLLRNMDGRKRIEEEMLKAIEESKQSQYNSLYDVYLHTAGRVAKSRREITK